MAITFVRETGKFRTGAGASVPGSFGVLPLVGSGIIVPAFFWHATDPGAITVSDDQGHPNYTQAVYAALGPTGNVRAGIWFLPAVVTSAGTFTVTVAAAGGAGTVIVANAMEWAGLDPTPLDQIASHTGTSTDAGTGTTPATTVADELLVASIVFNANPVSAPPDTGWDERLSETDGTTYIHGRAVSRVVSATGAQAHAWFLGGSAPFSAAIATFKIAAVGGGDSPLLTTLRHHQDARAA